MSPSVESDRPAPELAGSGPAPQAHAEAESPWTRIKEHKVLQWSLAYLGAALALAHGQELLAHNFGWPEMVGHVLIGTLIVGFPIAIALAWYHGHRGMTRFSAPEMTVIALLLLIGAVLLIALVRIPAEPTTQSRAPVASASQATTPTLSFTSAPAQQLSAAVPAASIAVVPFVNLTGDPGKEYFSDGMAEELINVLAQVPGLKVPSRTSSFAYKGRNVDIRRVAQDLGVATILEGSVRSAGQQIRVTAQLVNAQTGYHLWSKDYDRQFTDIFKLQDELAAAIVQALRTNLNVELPAATARAVPTQDVEAYRLYLQARGGWEEAGNQKTISLLDQALMRDPKFAQALAFRAEVRLVSVLNGGSPLHPALEDAEREAQEALALSPNLAVAHGVLGGVNFVRGNWLQAEASFRAGIAADPKDSLAAYALTVLFSAGRLRDAYSDLSEFYREGPADYVAAWHVAQADSALGHDEDAIKFADLATELGEARSVLAPGQARTALAPIYHDAAVRGRRYSEAAALAPELMPAAIRSAGDIGALNLFYAALADPTKTPAARQALESLTRKLELGDSEWPTRMIYFFTMLGALDEAYGVANQLLDGFARSGTVQGASTRWATWTILWIPEMSPFRKDPRFQAFVTRLGLIDYWTQYGPPDDCDLKDGKLTCR